MRDRLQHQTFWLEVQQQRLSRRTAQSPISHPQWAKCATSPTSQQQAPATTFSFRYTTLRPRPIQRRCLCNVLSNAIATVTAVNAKQRFGQRRCQYWKATMVPLVGSSKRLACCSLVCLATTTSWPRRKVRRHTLLLGACDAEKAFHGPGSSIIEVGNGRWRRTSVTWPEPGDLWRAIGLDGARHGAILRERYKYCSVVLESYSLYTVSSQLSFSSSQISFM